MNIVMNTQDDNQDARGWLIASDTRTWYRMHHRYYATVHVDSEYGRENTAIDKAIDIGLSICSGTALMACRLVQVTTTVIPRPTYDGTPQHTLLVTVVAEPIFPPELEWDDNEWGATMTNQDDDHQGARSWLIAECQKMGVFGRRILEESKELKGDTRYKYLLQQLEERDYDDIIAAYKQHIRDDAARWRRIEKERHLSRINNRLEEEKDAHPKRIAWLQKERAKIEKQLERMENTHGN